MPQHIIKRLTFRLHFPVRDRAVQLEHEVINIYKHRIEQLLDECFSRLAGADTEYRIEKIELDLGRIKTKSLSAEMPLRVRQQLGKIADNSQGSAAYTVSKQERQLILFRHFIETGTLPWWAGKLEKQALEQLVERLCAACPAEFREIMPDVLRDVNTAGRLVNQFSDKCLSRIGRLYLSEHEAGLIIPLLRDLEALFAELNRQETGRSITPGGRYPAGVPASAARRPGNDTASPVSSDSQDGDYGIDATGRPGWFDSVPGAARLREHYWRIVLSGLAHWPAGRFSLGKILQEIMLTMTGGNYEAGRHLLVRSGEAAGSLMSGHYRFSTSLPDLIENLIAGTAPEETGADTGNTLAGDTRGGKISGVQEATAARRKPDRDPFTDAEEDYVHNAGLVLLWPYLPKFFINLGLADENSFIDDLAAQRAVFLLQYLVESDAEIPESFLSLNKLLCGLELHRSFPAEFSPTAREQRECDALLGTVKLHWEVLSNMSADRIRTDFLQREGILRPCDGNWQLQVENQAQDILMKKLPWPTGVVKLPWMDYAILVHWG